MNSKGCPSDLLYRYDVLHDCFADFFSSSSFSPFKKASIVLEKQALGVSVG